LKAFLYVELLYYNWKRKKWVDSVRDISRPDERKRSPHSAQRETVTRSVLSDSFFLFLRRRNEAKRRCWVRNRAVSLWRTFSISAVLQLPNGNKYKQGKSFSSSPTTPKQRMEWICAFFLIDFKEIAIYICFLQYVC
jgi:hypothetical protein